jgi:hypothetical protein
MKVTGPNEPSLLLNFKSQLVKPKQFHNALLYFMNHPF